MSNSEERLPPIERFEQKLNEYLVSGKTNRDMLEIADVLYVLLQSKAVKELVAAAGYEVKKLKAILESQIAALNNDANPERNSVCLEQYIENTAQAHDDVSGTNPTSCEKVDFSIREYVHQFLLADASNNTGNKTYIAMKLFADLASKKAYSAISERNELVLGKEISDNIVYALEDYLNPEEMNEIESHNTSDNPHIGVSDVKNSTSNTQQASEPQTTIEKSETFEISTGANIMSTRNIK